MRLIDADSLIEECDKDGAYGYVDAFQIATAPTIDAEPVKPGRWEHNSDFPDRFICYGCGAMFDMWKHEQRLFNYCPNCGAKMDLEVDND